MKLKLNKTEYILQKKYLPFNLIIIVGYAIEFLAFPFIYLTLKFIIIVIDSIF